MSSIFNKVSFIEKLSTFIYLSKCTENDLNSFKKNLSWAPLIVLPFYFIYVGLKTLYVAFLNPKGNQ